MKFAVLFLTFVALSGCSPPPKAKAAIMSADVIATVGDTVIPLEDFMIHAASRGASADLSSQKIVLEELISEASLAEQARRQGIDQTPQFRRAVRQLLISQLEEKILLPQLVAAETVTDSEVQVVTETTAAQARETQRCYAWVLVKFSPTERSEGLARLAAIQAKISASPEEITFAGFGKIAAEFSEDTDTRYQGGVIGWFSQKQLPTRLSATLAEAVSSLSIGQVSPPINHPDGACLLLATSEKTVTAPAISPQAQAQQIRYDLVQSRQKNLRQAFCAAAREQAPIKINASALNAAAKSISEKPELTTPPTFGN